MFCPFLSAGKATPVECDPNCALYNGSADGKTEKECVLFTIGYLASENHANLAAVSIVVDEIAADLAGVKDSLRDLADKQR